MQAFSGDHPSAWRGLSPEAQLTLRVLMWKGAPELLRTLLVAVDDEQVIGSLAVNLAALPSRFPRLPLPVIRGMGLRRAAHHAARSALLHYAPAAQEAYLFAVVVDRSRRRGGIGRALIAAAEQQAADRGKGTITSIVHRTNTPQIELFASMGYRLARPTRSLARRLLAPSTPFLQAVKRLPT